MPAKSHFDSGWIANPDPYALEPRLAAEFALLVAQTFLGSPGDNGQSELAMASGEVGAAATGSGALRAAGNNAENFLLAASPPPVQRPQRFLAAVSEGNYKDPVTVLGGTIALSELYRRSCGARQSDNLEDDVRVALAEAVQRITQINRVRPSHMLRQWPLGSFQTASPFALQGLGSSVTAVAVAGRDAVLAHVGECQAYRIGVQGRSLEQLSANHTLAADPTFQPEGNPVPAGLEFWGGLPRFVLGSCQLADIQIEWFTLHPGDTLLLCSSSLRKRQLTEDEIIHIVKGQPPSLACAQLLQTKLPSGRHAPGTTVVILHLPG